MSLTAITSSKGYLYILTGDSYFCTIFRCLNPSLVSVCWNAAATAVVKGVANFHQLNNFLHQVFFVSEMHKSKSSNLFYHSLVLLILTSWYIFLSHSHHFTYQSTKTSMIIISCHHHTINKMHQQLV